MNGTRARAQTNSSAVARLRAPCIDAFSTGPSHKREKCMNVGQNGDNRTFTILTTLGANSNGEEHAEFI